jgi:peroxiredoxin
MAHLRVSLASLLLSSSFVLACSHDKSPSTTVAPAPVAAPAEAPAAALAPAPAAPTSAVVGKPAPAFTLKDLDGKEVSLASYAGKTVVLEWFNPSCPFVKASHSAGSLKEEAKKQIASGVVWLAINSGAPGKQGYEVDANREALETFGLVHPVLRDEDGKIGRAYGATNTPNLFVIDKTGTVVYAGAIDNSPDGEGQSPAGGKLVNYVDAALADLAAGRPVQTPVTKPYGCGVKYGS